MRTGNMGELGGVLTRRDFARGSTLAGLAAAAAVIPESLFGCAPQQELSSTEGMNKLPASPAAGEGEVKWTYCTASCTSKCPLRMHIVDGEIKWVETDNTECEDDPSVPQYRACARGRSLRRWVYSEDRIKYPMRRTSKRGSGEFERISWDEAVQIVGDKMKEVYETYGPEAVMWLGTNSAQNRFLSMMGGYLWWYGNWSNGTISSALPYTFIDDTKDARYNVFVSRMHASPLLEALNSDLVVLFGCNPNVVGGNGGGQGTDLIRVRENGARIIHIDPRRTESTAGGQDEWIPIRPATDAALCSALCYVMVKDEIADFDFLNSHCVGFDETTMPEGAPEHASYLDYLMGTGYDMVEKTPEWAEEICGVPADRIRKLAHEICEAKACYIAQGDGPQRRQNGDQAVRSIVMVPIVSGQIGKPGTSTGAQPAGGGGGVSLGRYGAEFYSIPNPVTKEFPLSLWSQVIDHGTEMTAKRHGIKGADKLDVPIKLIWINNCNWLSQGLDANYSAKVLEGESKCEFIVASDIQLNPTVRYADIILPVCTLAEEEFGSGSQGGFKQASYMVMHQGGIESLFESKTDFEACRLIAAYLGREDEFTAGMTEYEHMRSNYDACAERCEFLPSYEEAMKVGFMKFPHPEVKPFLSDFRDDPQANPLSTDSGKIEIYSQALSELAEFEEFDDPRNYITPVPTYRPGVEGWTDTTEEFPLVFTGIHSRQRSGSTWGNVDILNATFQNDVWINPLDADPHGIESGDEVLVESPRGKVQVVARVTPAIIPGAVMIPQGGWYSPDENGVDQGGCANTLSLNNPVPIGWNNASHTAIVQVSKR